MKKYGRLSALLLAVCLSLSLMTPCFAASAVVVAANSTQESTIIEPRADVVPTEYRNLSNADYTAQLLDLAATKSSLTKYYFTTGTGEIKLSFDLERSGTTQETKRVLTVYLYERPSNGYWFTEKDPVSVTFYTTEHSATRSFTGLDPDHFYYLKFKNESSTSSGARMDISGTILVTE